MVGPLATRCHGFTMVFHDAVSAKVATATGGFTVRQLGPSR